MKTLRIKLKQNERQGLKWLSVSIIGGIELVSLAGLRFSYVLGTDPNPRFYVGLVIGGLLITAFLGATFIRSKFSPVRVLKLRKQLILFTYQMTHKVENESNFLLVEWRYEVSGEHLNIILYSNGLVKDKRWLAQQLSEYLRLELISFKEEPIKCKMTFGKSSERLDGLRELANGRL